MRVAPASFLGWNVVLQAPEPVDLFGYTHLRLVFHPGDAEGRSLSLILSSEETSKNIPLAGLNAQEDQSIDLTRADWQVIEIPLPGTDIAKLTINSVTLNGDLEGTFYIDDLRLVAPETSSTAIVEAHTSSLPTSFALEQNYPNPFNAGTAIRFALPQDGPVDLALYDMIGQKVATLVQGVRPAGTYTVHWDGRDENGLERATGVYFYRLKMDSEEVAKKLLLIR